VHGVARPRQLTRHGHLRGLVPEDDHTVRASLCRSHWHHHDVADVDDGSAIVQLIESGARFDAIPLDLEMPFMTGWRAWAALAAASPEHAKSR